MLIKDRKMGGNPKRMGGKAKFTLAGKSREE